MNKTWIFLIAGSWLACAQEAPKFDPKLNVAAQAAADRAAQVVKGAPFSAVAVRDWVRTLADGNRIFTHQEEKMARDSQGRERREVVPNVEVLGQQLPVGSSVQIADPVAGVRYALNPKELTARRTAGGVGPIFARTAAAPAAVPRKRTVKIHQLPAQTIEGVWAQGTLTTTTIPAGQVGNERYERDVTVADEVWYSPDLQMDVMTKHDDPRSGESTYRLTQINRNEPDSSLFEVPKGYTIIGPPQRSATFTVTGPDGETITTTESQKPQK